MEYDVAIIGGGPSGSTAATFLKKYRPELKVAIFEREVFPRDHIGESQLPVISQILDEMGVWDKVEAANFPIKIGSTNKWGKKPELWDLEFYQPEAFKDEPRPANFEGQRRFTAFQVDRSIYDKILLDHAQEMGVVVHQPANVQKVHREGDQVRGLELASGEQITAKYYLDASGHYGVLRRAIGVDCEYPSNLKNIAVWDYWQNTEWAVKIGVGATKIQVMSLGYGWIWFIPLGPTRTSIGLVVPAEYYKKCGMRPEEMYLAAIAEEERISGLCANATREMKFEATKDWSFLSSRQCGDNWFLVGESAGFADPILSAGLSMAHAAGREVAFTVIELERGKQKASWLKEQFQTRQSQRVTSHIRFADFWYTANAQFVDIKDHIQGIAKDIGLDLTPDKAWQWLAQGGFVDEDLSTGFGSFTLFGIKDLSDYLADFKADFPFSEYNKFTLDLSNSAWKDRAQYENGTVRPRQCYVRDGKVLPIDGPFESMVTVLQRTPYMGQILELINKSLDALPDQEHRYIRFYTLIQAFEAMIADGWVKASYDPSQPGYNLRIHGNQVRWNKDTIG